MPDNTVTRILSKTFRDDEMREKKMILAFLVTYESGRTLAIFGGMKMKKVAENAEEHLIACNEVFIYNSYESAVNALVSGDIEVED